MFWISSWESNANAVDEDDGIRTAWFNAQYNSSNSDEGTHWGVKWVTRRWAKCDLSNAKFIKSFCSLGLLAIYAWNILWK